jgi:hypothetical protein
MIVIKCDKCGVMHEKERGDVSMTSPKGWFPLMYRKGYSGSVTHHLCPDCRKVLKIPDDKPDDDVAQRFLELLADIVTDEVADRLA